MLSINASAHKFGLVYPGLGWVIFRRREVFNEDLVFYVNYLGGESATATLNLSRNAALKDEFGNFNEFDVSFKVREKGWVLSAYSMPPNAEDVYSLRAVVRPHLNRGVIDNLADDVISACRYLQEHGGAAKPPALHGHTRSAPKC